MVQLWLTLNTTYMLNKRKWMLPLLAAGCVATMTAATPPAKGEGVRLPASYTDFFPSLRQEKHMIPFTGKPAGKPAYVGRSAAISAESGIYGYLYYFQDTQLQQGFYRINPTPAPTHLWTDEYTGDWSMTMTGGWLRNGRVCGLNSMIFMGGMLGYGQVELDLETGKVLNFRQLTVSADDVTNIYLSSTYRILDDRVYGFGEAGDGEMYAFKSADADNIDTSKVVREVDFEQLCVALTYNVQDDMFYGVTTQGKFASVSPAGEVTEIMDLGIKGFSAAITGLTYSPRDKAYIYNAYLEDRSSAMYSIDPIAKTCTKIYDNLGGEEYTFMICTRDNVEDDAPAIPEYVSYGFTGASNDGTMTYKLPTATASGATLSGTLDWRVMVDGVQAATGTGNAGSQVVANLTGIADGMHTFAFSAGKDGKWSIPTTLTRWVGADYPVAPADVVLTNDKATWSAPTTSVHDGYVDYSAITYKVKLNGKEVATTSDTECAITLPEGEKYTSYQVEVTATAAGKESEPGVSNYITYGSALTVPADGSLHFRPEEYESPLFKAIDIDGKLDSQGNPRNWHFSTTMGFPSFASGADGEDLLVFPPINFETADKAYQYQMEAGLISDIDKTGTIEVLIGKEPNLESMTRVVIAPYKLQYMRGIIMTEYFSVPEPGTYYIGVLTKCNNVAMHISDMDISLTDRDSDMPETVTGLKAEAAPKGACKAIVTFKMPEKTLGGKEIPKDAVIKATLTSRKYVLDKPFEGEVKATSTVTGHPGETVTGEVDTWQGYNTIGVSCSLSDAPGVETTTRLYTGLVRPYIVQNFKTEVSEDDMSIKLSWTPPVEGEEEGEIGDSFLYTVWWYNNGWEFLADAGWDTSEYTVELEKGNPLTLLMLGVMAYNEAGQSDHISSGSVVAGTPYTLPMKETLPDGEETCSPISIIRPSEEYNDVYWMVTDPSEISAIFANKSGWAYVGYIGTQGVKSGMGRLALPKFSTVDCKDVKITLEYWGGPYNASFSLLSDVYGGTAPKPIGDFPTGKGWMSSSLALPAELEGLEWVQLLLDTKYESTDSYAMISGYTITGVSGVSAPGTDGGARIFTTPGMLHVAGLAGESLTVCDTAGRVVKQVTELGDLAGYMLAPGIYVVRAGDLTRTVTVR